MFKKIVSSLCIITLLLSVPCRAKAYTLPETVRIGLYYKDTSEYVDTAVSYIHLSSPSGLNISDKINGNIQTLLTHGLTTVITVRKDTWYKKDGDVFTASTESGLSSYSGVKIGPYHVEIGSPFQDIALLKEYIVFLAGCGITAYPAYDGAWHAWSGFHTSNADAQSAMEMISAAAGQTACTVIQPGSDKIVAEKSDGSTILLYVQKSGALQFSGGVIAGMNTVKLGSKNYRGAIEVKRLTASDMTVVNELKIDEYLYGVVPKEIESWSHPEALKAQAIAARTYTANNRNRHKSLGFDLCPTTRCQVYGGYDAENDLTNAAVDATSGKVVTYNGELAATYYFSSDGGYTEDVRYVWGGTGYPYLVSVEDKYERGNSWNYNWVKTFTIEELTQIMKQKQYNIGTVKRIDITATSPTGRVTEMIVVGTEGQEKFVREGCRLVFGSLPSQWFTYTTDSLLIAMNDEFNVAAVTYTPTMVITADDQIVPLQDSISDITVIGADNVLSNQTGAPTTFSFTGKGWGHAVGMSQEGAKGMAEAGFTCEEILTHYYTGTEVR
ncbi:MAG: SpoIID/LytB domain-containing protein [Eubacteriales bacterium]|nr:SpoIID/LytB domain-containing protein [Eubacteriales bacterium]